MKLFNLILLTILSLSLSAQSLDEELGFIYVKADYLIETNRFDEAIQEFTKIIAKDPSFRDAMYKRAYAKFQVGAFKGTKNDLLDVFNTKGITPEALLLFGKTQRNLGNDKAATQTLATADMCGSSSSHKSSTGSTGSSGNNDDKNQGSNSDAIKDEVKKIEDKLSSILDDLLPGNKDDNEGSSSDKSSDSRSSDTSSSDRTPTQREETNRSPSGRNTDNSSNGNTSSDVKDQKTRTTDVVEDNTPKVDNSVREIFIDEDVTLEVKNGLGARKILQQPSILILSETSGSVVVDLCVNSNGKVINAEFNKAASTLATQSIISLAVRKTKEFWFKSSGEREMCGSIVYNITGS